MAKKRILNILKDLLQICGIGITRYDSLRRLRELERAIHDDRWAARELTLLQHLNDKNAEYLLDCFSKSQAQLRQDLFVLHQTNFKRGGYFVEFGAANGRDLSNTYLLEKSFDWSGILAEPARYWHSELANNRSCNIETRCVWKSSNVDLEFNEVDVAELSTINRYSSLDDHKEARKAGRTYKVSTISLNDLLSKYKAPKTIEYLSLDTEGSEYDILNELDFSYYSFEVITCEHNYTPQRDIIYELLLRHGYKRVLQEYTLFDDWYVKSAS